VREALETSNEAGPRKPDTDANAADRMVRAALSVVDLTGAVLFAIVLVLAAVIGLTLLSG